MFRLAIFIVLCIATAAFHIPRNVLSRKTVTFAKEKEVIPENETEAQLRERMKKKARKMMFNENGVAYGILLINVRIAYFSLPLFLLLRTYRSSMGRKTDQ